MFVPFCHDTLHIGTQKQVFHTDLYLLDMLHLDDMADIGRGKPVNLLHLLHGVVAFIVHEVGSAEFVQMGFGVIGTSVFSFGGYLMAVGEGTECGRLHAEQFFHLLGQEPVGNSAYIDSDTEKLIYMLLAVIVLSCDTADGDMVALGGSVKPRLLYLKKGHHLLSRIEVQHFIAFLFPYFSFGW